MDIRIDYWGMESALWLDDGERLPEVRASTYRVVQSGTAITTNGPNNCSAITKHASR